MIYLHGILNTKNPSTFVEFNRKLLWLLVKSLININFSGFVEKLKIGHTSYNFFFLFPCKCLILGQWGNYMIFHSPLKKIIHIKQGCY